MISFSLPGYSLTELDSTLRDLGYVLDSLIYPSSEGESRMLYLKDNSNVVVKQGFIDPNLEQRSPLRFPIIMPYEINFAGSDNKEYKKLKQRFPLRVEASREILGITEEDMKKLLSII